MDMNNYLNLNNFNIDFMLKLLQDHQKLINENKILKNSLKISSKPTKKASKPTPKFYLTPKIGKLIEKCIKTLKQADPISGWFLHLLAISGCRGTELQKVKMQDISTFLSKNGKTLYNIKVNVAKKRNVTCIREIVINSEEFEAIQTAHKNHFNEKNLDTRRTYFFQKSKHKFKDNQISIIHISNKFKNLLKKSGFCVNKSLHLCRNLFISNLKSNGYNSFQIKELMKYSSTNEIDNIYGLSSANKIQAYECAKKCLKL
ncbi:tyrosine-type recombinase/integrase [Borreliella burgdorferi]|uniref:Plasmid cp18, OspE (ospE) protein n=2 Tax=Borreliella burgdorferi TaxID=139 RepID=Q44753_BORBG|nr:tyrosine-type recombinase/integrase [Borreliella burgdorferi]AAB63432.1 ORF-6; by homology to cp8.3 [Borreliella burgdorferi N40]PRR13362.1 site-specific integrase [Borreliella burgdorferi]PRR14786.1 site-specific integrase [Borreliella burgdorferi]PRR22197.1 site-specific integrase [Borreliella burgdorferi]PRR27043.1 site-specific integrase [Borreliella burgdorferi]